MDNAATVGKWLKDNIPSSPLIREVRGRGLMLGIEFNVPVSPVRSALLYDKHIFTGVSGKGMIRLLAPLVLSVPEASRFIDALGEILENQQ